MVKLFNEKDESNDSYLNHNLFDFLSRADEKDFVLVNRDKNTTLQVQKTSFNNPGGM